MTTAAVFWDRDNTLIEDPGYLSDPEQVKLIPGAAKAIRRLADAGFENIIVTNQSGIARGLLDEPTLERIHVRLRELLAGEGAELDAIYYCPYLDGPEATVEAYRLESDLRKPKPGMLAKASLERQIDLSASWMIGNSVCDAHAGRAAGCRTVLIANGTVSRDRSVDFTASSLDEAVDLVLKHTVTAMPGSATAGAPPESAADSAGAANKTLQEILAFLRTVDRRNQAEDFSLGRLAGIIVQMLALAALVWAVFGMIRGEEYGAQIIKLLFTIALQAIALTSFLASSKK
jgi:D-glycero-D-manno-heptose 1,7-bisphosphate phosphatase